MAAPARRRRSLRFEVTHRQRLGRTGADVTVGHERTFDLNKSLPTVRVAYPAASQLVEKVQPIDILHEIAGQARIVDFADAYIKLFDN